MREILIPAAESAVAMLNRGGLNPVSVSMRRRIAAAVTALQLGVDAFAMRPCRDAIAVVQFVRDNAIRALGSCSRSDNGGSQPWCVTVGLSTIAVTSGSIVQPDVKGQSMRK